MSASKKVKALTPPQIMEMKGKAPIAMLTAYTTPIAQMIDPHVDVILVGDSVGMVLHGMTNTIGVTMEMMIMHGKAVARGAKQALLVIDMPFGSYEKSPEHAFTNAVRLMRETGCAAVKLEGGVEMAETISFLTQRGIPVMAHVGLTPQSVNQFGGYKTQGLGDDKERIIKDALAVEEAGAFSIVCEKIPDPLAREITSKLKIPTIGIGASAACDGQVLVTDDILGMFKGFKPKFVKQYINLSEKIDEIAEQYAKEVRERSFPTPDHVYDYAGES